MLKFARRRARSSEREPVKSVVMNNSLSKPRASSAERASKTSDTSRDTVTVPSLTPSTVEARTASISKSVKSHESEVRSAASVKQRNCIFQESETDLPAFSMSVTRRDGEAGVDDNVQMTVTVSQLSSKMSQTQISTRQCAPHEASPSISDTGHFTKQIHKPGLVNTPPALPRKPLLGQQHDSAALRTSHALLGQQHRHLWKMELLDTSGESGYGTDSSDNNSLKSVNSNTETDTSPPPLPKRKPRRRVQFDSYVLLIQSLKDRDLKGILSTIFNVSSEALCTEDVIYHFHTSILRQDYEVFELLVRGGVEVNTFDHRGWSALHCAASLARLDMIKLLLQNGAAVLARTHHSSQTSTQLLPVENPAYPQCLAYMRCMEECLGTVNNRLVLAAANYRATRIDEMSINKGDRLNVQRRGDVNNEMWWWVKNSRGEEGYVLRDLLSLNSRHS